MGGEAKRPSLRRWILLAAVAVPVLAFVLPPLVNVNRYQHRIADNISRSIGRPVHISSVQMRLLPLPGLEFSDFSVEEKPEFGSEPILHANSVVADLRLLSLWRGRLDVSRIHFDEASLNLVRSPKGTWNFASILLQAAQIPNAPTGQPYAGGAPRFPYIDAENSRVNFKEGNEKKPLSFLNSDLSISLNSANEWELHFRAQPVRTDLDLDLADTGVLRMDGTLRRAAMLSQMPLKLEANWTGVPLGQLSRLTLGRDIGWRGGLELQAQVEGTAELAQINSALKVAGLHRSEFTPARPLDIATTCHAVFQRKSSGLNDISCSSPVGEGAVLVTGSLHQVQTVPQAQLALKIDHVPASAILASLQEVRSDLGAGVQVAGAVNGQFDYVTQDGGPPSITGEAALDSLALTSPDAGKPFLVGPVRVRCESAGAANDAAAYPALLLQPIRLAMGAPVPVTVNGHFNPAGFDLHLSGNAALARLQPFSKRLAVFTGGTATLDLDVRGKWLLPVPDSEHPVASSTTEGSITIRNTELNTTYLAEPVRIVSAQGILNPTQIAWTNAAISYGKLEAQGTLEYPTLCTAAKPCAGRFTLHASALDLGALQSALLGTSQGGELLRQFLDRIGRHPMPWPDLAGTVSIGTLSAGKWVVHDAAGAVDISGNVIKVSAFNGHVANGIMHLAGAVDASGDQPEYRMDVQVTNAVPNALASMFDERWGGGLASFSAQVKMSGFEPQELASSATGSLRWDWTKGGLTVGDTDTSPAVAQPLAHFDQWTGDAAIGDHTIKIRHSLLAQGQEAIPVSGTIFFDRSIDLTGGSAASGFTATGNLEHPEVKVATEAADK